MSTTEIVFAIIAIIATIVPTICDAIAISNNNKNIIKLEKIKHYEKERINSLNNFIKESHEYFSIMNTKTPTQEEFQIYHSNMILSFLKLQIYFKLDTATRDKLFDMERKGGYSDWEFRNNLIVNLSQQIDEYIKK